jgi:hypothetical protein
VKNISHKDAKENRKGTKKTLETRQRFAPLDFPLWLCVKHLVRIKQL